MWIGETFSTLLYLDLHLVQKKVYLFISARFVFFCSVQGVKKKNARYVLYQ